MKKPGHGLPKLTDDRLIKIEDAAMHYWGRPSCCNRVSLPPQDMLVLVREVMELREKVKSIEIKDSNS